MPYDLLSGIRVLEVALLAPAAVGGILADLGAEVIKVEEPPVGDYMRTIGPVAVGDPMGMSLMYMKWNRGKRSLAMSLKTEDGKRTFLDLAKRSHVVIEGLRAGALDRWGVGYEALRAVNPAIVYCSLSGLGRSGPYARLPVHGQFFDAFAGYMPASRRDDGSVRADRSHAPHAGLNASGVWAALAVTSALISALRTGRGKIVEVAEIEVSAFWNWQDIEVSLNREKIHRRASYGAVGMDSVRHNYYETKDGRFMQFMAPEFKFWDNFLGALGREDLKAKYPPRYSYDHQYGEEGLRRELIEIFRARTQDEWTAFFIEHNIAGGPVHSADEVPADRHFAVRGNVYDVDQPETGPLRLLGTPIKLDNETFSAGPAPAIGQDTDYVLGEILGYSLEMIEALIERGSIARAGLTPPDSR